MSGPVRAAAGWALAALATLAVVGLSRVPWAEERAAGAELRLAWRWKSERVRRCRTLSPAEVAKLPAHMRRTEDCQRGLRPWRLEVAVDGAAAADDTIRARGAESDRPLFVFRRVPVAPGSHVLQVRFSPVGEGGPPPVGLDTVVSVAARRAVLVTMEEDTGRLALRAAAP
ncbi:MAG TPA: hypothetical protein VEH83_07225 [Gemmatimonadales bacterium]|nr:hypothetical protein [Gemmatimonadales bacterium]